MRPVDQAYEQLRRANPVPNPAALLRELAESVNKQEGEQPTGTITTDRREPTPTGRPRGWTVALTAAVVVLILGIGTVFVATGDNPFAFGEPTPVEIAEAYIDARNDYDYERARALIAEDFTTSEAPDGHVDVSTLELVFPYWDAYGVEFTDVKCVHVSEGDGGQLVRCDYLWDTHLHRIGNFPLTEANLTLLIEDGLIRNVVETGSYEPWWSSFVSFLESEAPDFLDTIDRAIEMDPEAVQKLIGELPGYLDLYAEWIDNQSG